VNEARTIPNNSTHDVVTFDILIEGQALSSAFEINHISVIQEINRIPKACIEIIDGEASTESFELSNQELLNPGKTITIKVGRDRKNNTVFQGIITKHSVHVEENGNSCLRVECQDECIRMAFGRHSLYYRDTTDQQVIEEIIGRYAGLSHEVDETNIQHAELVQHHCTDWDFILSRADVNSKVIAVANNKIRVFRPDANAEPVLTLKYGATIVEFHGEIDARHQWKKVDAESWDYANQSLFQSEADSISFQEAGSLSGADLATTLDLESYELRHTGHIKEEELQALVESCLLKSRLAKIRGRAKILVGVGAIKPGEVLALNGVGDKFNGKVFVSAVRQEIGQGEWDTYIQFGLSPEWFASAPEIIDFPAAGLSPAVHGLQIGKVVQLQDDPAGEHRIQVRLPIISPADPGIWARVATLDAGDDRGSFFRPEIDDEVVVGFLNGDPCDPIVVGMLNSSAKPAWIIAQDTNHEKGIKTREDLRVHFHDETKTITIDTPAGNKIILDEANKTLFAEDQHGNIIKMESGGITIKSPQSINIEAGTSIQIKAGTNLELEALNIKEKAQASIQLEGATAKLSSQGITEVKGSLVNIN